MLTITFQILGRVEALADGRPLDLSSRRERALLGVLLLYAGEVVTVDTLIASVWGEPAPPSARHMVHEYVSRLRVTLGDPALIATRPGGYAVARDERQLDAACFAERCGAARGALAAGELELALQTFDEALGLWRGDALSDVALEGDARLAAVSLDDQRRAARTERTDVALALGGHQELVPELERAVASDPLDERALRQLMLALYQSGRQADALERYRDGRARLDEVGINPSAQLRALEQAILQQDPTLAPPLRTASAGRAAAPRRRRRAAGFALAGSALAAVALAAVLARYAQREPVAPVRGNAVAIVDAARGRLLGSIPLEARPAAITAGFGSIWVASPDTPSLVRISPAERRVVASPRLDNPAQSLATSARAVWAVGSRDTESFLTLERVDPTFNTVTHRRLATIAAGDSVALAAGRRSVTVAPGSGVLTTLDARSGRLLGNRDSVASPTAIAQGFGSTWLAERDANLVLRIDASGITPIPVGRGPSAITVGRRAVWVANMLDGTVKPIDPANNSPITIIKVGAAPAAIAEGGGSVWVANSGDGTLTRIDERTMKPSAPIVVGGSPQALVVADGKVWVSVQLPAPVKPSGGTLVVSVPFKISLDPAVVNSGAENLVEHAICSSLFNYPDEPAPAGNRLVPDAARQAPTVSDGGLTYAFVIRAGLRFSPPSNELVNAQTFKHSIERSLSPRMKLSALGAPAQGVLSGVVGEAAYIAGKARHIAGITARGNRLTVRLTGPDPELVARLSSDGFCAVPSDMPPTPVKGPFPSAGPYYVKDATSVVKGDHFVLLRNPNYHGDRLRRPRRIEVVVVDWTQDPVAAVEASHLDYAYQGVLAEQERRLERLYGAKSPAARAGRQRYFVSRQPQVDIVQLNASRPLFSSARMRRAANYAADRRSLAANGGSLSAHAQVAQMYLPPDVPGFRDEHLYRLRPDLAAARRLASHGHHSALLYCISDQGSGNPRAAQIIAHDLAAIHIDVQVRCLPGSEYWQRMVSPHAPWDMTITWSFGSDPSDYLDGFLSSDAWAPQQLHDPRLDALLHAAGRKTGLARASAYARIDHLLVRNLAPFIAYANESSHDFLSARIGCHLYQPSLGMDLGAFCLRSGRDAGPAKR